METSYKIRLVDYAEIAHLREEAAVLGSGVVDIDVSYWFAAFSSDEGELAGCIGMHVKGGAGRIRGWYVKPELQGAGLGKRLLNAQIRNAKSLQLKRLEMNTRHHEMVKKWGWTGTGQMFWTRPWFTGGGERLIYDGIPETPIAPANAGEAGGEASGRTHGTRH